MMRYFLSLCFSILLITSVVTGKEKPKIVFLSGTPSHGRMHHEHRAGNMILAEALNRSGLDINAVVVPHYGYPKDKTILQDAASVVIFCTGHRGHLLNPNKKFSVSNPAKTCVSCHHGSHSPLFSFEKYWPKVQHK